MPGDDAPPQLLALDWGTSNVRAMLMRSGEVVDRRRSGDGVLRLRSSPEAFEHALDALAGDWLKRWPALPVLACGTVGSAQGWREAPYVDCPADPRDIAAGCVAVPNALGAHLHIVPGLRWMPPTGFPDVLRSEETQIAGALRTHPHWALHATMVLPGTHSKWVHVEAGHVTRFRSFMTGELFGVLREHSILGRLMPPATDEAGDPAAFTMGLDAARHSAPGVWLNELFATRTLGLTGRLPARDLAEFLSGLLIGHELRAGLAAVADPALPFVLVGEPTLCRRYVAALARFGRGEPAVLHDAAADGLWLLAQAAGLVPPSLGGAHDPP
jgi:2-dehydro-3-deoxygalactonokinase